MNPITLEHGERYGSLVVVAKSKTSNKYLCGFSCGRREHFRAKALMRADGVRECRRCTKAKQSASTFNPAIPHKSDD